MRTSDGMSFVAADVEIKQYETDTWLSLSCFSAMIGVTGGDRAIGSQNVFCDEKPIVRAGKLAHQLVTIRFVYTEEAGAGVLAETGWAGDDSPFQTIRLWNEEEGGEMWVRYWPAGAVVGNYVFETGAGVIATFQDPGGEAGPGTVVMGEVTVACEVLEKSAWGGGT